MYFGSTFRTTAGGRICCGGAPGCGSRSANHTSQLPEKLVTFGIWIAMLYTTRPANLGSGTTKCDARDSAGIFGAPGATRAAANRFSLEVGEKLVAIVGRVSLAPPCTTNPGTFNSAMRLAPVPPSSRGCGPAEKPAAREAGGAGTSIVLAGFSPTIASEASAVARASYCCRGRLGGDRRSRLRLRGKLTRHGSPAAPSPIPLSADAQAGYLGSRRQTTVAATRDFPAGATNVWAAVSARHRKRQRVRHPPPYRAADLLEVGSMACRCIRTFGGGVNARRGPPSVTSGSVTPPSHRPQPRAARPPAASPPVPSRVLPAAPRTAALLSGTLPPPHWAAVPASRLAVSGSGAQIRVAGRASSLSPATIVCGAFTRARGGRASRSRIAPDPISGSFSCRLYQTIFFSFGRISWS